MKAPEHPVCEAVEVDGRGRGRLRIGGLGGEGGVWRDEGAISWHGLYLGSTWCHRSAYSQTCGLPGFTAQVCSENRLRGGLEVDVVAEAF